MFNKNVLDLIKLQEKLSKKYGNDVFINEILEILEVNLPKKYPVDDVTIIPPKESHEDNMIIQKESLEKRIYYLPYKYYKSDMEVKKDEKKKDKICLKNTEKIKKLNIEKIKNIKLEIQNRKTSSKIKDIKDIEVKLLISDKLIDKEIEKDKFLLEIQNAAKKVSKLMNKISDHLTEKTYIIEKVESLKGIINDLSKLSLNDPRFIDCTTELTNTNKIFEEFQNIKMFLINKFEKIRENYLRYEKISEDFKNDKVGVSRTFKLTNKIKFVENKALDFSNFKESSFNSPYIMLSNDNKTIQASYPTIQHLHLK